MTTRANAEASGGRPASTQGRLPSGVYLLGPLARPSPWSAIGRPHLLAIHGRDAVNKSAQDKNASRWTADRFGFRGSRCWSCPRPIVPGPAFLPQARRALGSVCSAARAASSTVGCACCSACVFSDENCVFKCHAVIGSKSKTYEARATETDPGARFVLSRRRVSQISPCGRLAFSAVVIGRECSWSSHLPPKTPECLPSNPQPSPKCNRTARDPNPVQVGGVSRARCPAHPRQAVFIAQFLVAPPPSRAFATGQIVRALMQTNSRGTTIHIAKYPQTTICVPHPRC